MNTEQKETCRYYVTYSGVGLPLNLISQLDESSIERRLTYFRAFYDAHERLVRVEKIVYGEIEFIHCYEYDENGRLISVEKAESDGDTIVQRF